MKKNIKLLLTTIIFTFSLSMVMASAITKEDIKECVKENLNELTKDKISKENKKEQNSEVTEEDVRKCVIENLDELKKIN